MFAAITLPTRIQDSLRNQAWLLKKSSFPQTAQIWGMQNALKIQKVVCGHPSAILFLLISRVGLFQQPQAIALKIPCTLGSLRIGHIKTENDPPTATQFIARWPVLDG